MDQHLASRDLRAEEVADLNSADPNTMLIETWAWLQYAKYFKDYCEIAEKFKCAEEISSKNLIGTVGPDWSPLGFSSKRPRQMSCSQEQQRAACTITSFPNWPRSSDQVFSQFGTRVFFIRNLGFDEIGGLVLINFDQPAKQRIPDVSRAFDQ